MYTDDISSLRGKIVTAIEQIEKDRKRTCCHAMSSARSEGGPEDTIEVIREDREGLVSRSVIILICWKKPD